MSQGTNLISYLFLYTNYRHGTVSCIKFPYSGRLTIVSIVPWHGAPAEGGPRSLAQRATDT